MREREREGEPELLSKNKNEDEDNQYAASQVCTQSTFKSNQLAQINCAPRSGLFTNSSPSVCAVLDQIIKGGGGCANQKQMRSNNSAHELLSNVHL